jgi:hypothetical protein
MSWQENSRDALYCKFTLGAFCETACYSMYLSDQHHHSVISSAQEKSGFPLTTFLISDPRAKFESSRS